MDNKDYEKLDIYYHDQIAAASAFSTANPNLLSGTRSILKKKVQAEKQLAIPKTAKYEMWNPARAHTKNNIKTANILEIAQKFRRKKEIHFNASIKLQFEKLEWTTIQSASINKAKQN